MAKDARRTEYGKRKLGQKAWEAREAAKQTRSRDSTVYGKRKAGAKRSPSKADTTETILVVDGDGRPAEPSANPFVAETGERVTIARLEELLDEHPEYIDLALETELGHEDPPRKGALAHLRSLEGTRPEGPRESVISLLNLADEG